MHIGYIGLGKMGQNMVARLLAKGHTITAYDKDAGARDAVAELGAHTVSSLSELLLAVPSPRILWLMVPHQVVEEVLEEVLQHVKHGDTIFEGGNSPYKETIRRGKMFEEKGVNLIDVGVSGGPDGARNGACLMIGGKKEIVHQYEKLYVDLSVPDGFAYVGSCGSGHFVKMVHNGIEYGMMQAIAEGFDVLRNANFEHPFPLTKIASLYTHGSVIESRLVDWLRSGFTLYGEDLVEITGSASASGEGLWTVETAQAMGVAVPGIEAAVQVRTDSQKNPSYQGKLISVMRNQFGGHDTRAQ